MAFLLKKRKCQKEELQGYVYAAIYSTDVEGE